METFPQIWVIALDQLTRVGKACNWSDMLAHQLKEQVIRAWQPPKGSSRNLHFSYILDEIYAHQEFPGFKWAWISAKTSMNTYCKMFSECSFRGIITQLSNHFVTLVYKMIFKQDPPYILKATIEAIIDIANCYGSSSNTFIWMYNVEKPPHVLPKFSLDKLIM